VAVPANPTRRNNASASNSGAAFCYNGVIVVDIDSCATPFARSGPRFSATTIFAVASTIDELANPVRPIVPDGTGDPIVFVLTTSSLPSDCLLSKAHFSARFDGLRRRCRVVRRVCRFIARNF
jgi:hypothetical protein